MTVRVEIVDVILNSTRRPAEKQGFVAILWQIEVAKHCD